MTPDMMSAELRIRAGRLLHAASLIDEAYRRVQNLWEWLDVDEKHRVPVLVGRQRLLWDR